jgi:DNA-nicking Smr family endonuclease
MFNFTDVGIFMKTNLTKGNIKAFLAKNAPPSATTGTAEPLETESSFAELHPDITPLRQDKIAPIPPQKSLADTSLSKHVKQRKQRQQLTSSTKQRNAEFTFSDGFEAHFPEDTALLWHQGDKRCAALLKRCRRGDFTPEYVLDCHGMTKAHAKEELGALLVQAYKQDVACVSIMHGHGSGVLKRAIPNYIMQYPHIIGFCQAPKQWGGQAGILILLDVPQLSQFA